MRIVPRDYQVEAVDTIFEYFRNNNGNPIVAMPTATGKSVVIASFLERVYKQWPNQKIMIVTHVKELVLQNYQKMMSLWPEAPAGINSAGLGQRDVHNRIIFAGIGSVVRHPELFGNVDLVIVDEAHMVSPSSKTMYQKFFAGLKIRNPHIKGIGLTATPWRLGQGDITKGGFFTDTCFDITSYEAFNRLIEEGYLAPLIPKRTKLEIDVSSLSISGGDFKKNDLQVAVDQDSITEAALRETLELSEGRKHWLIFSSGLHHAERISEMLDYMGVSNVVIHSKISTDERDERLRKFTSGEVTAAVNYGVLTTGFDYPDIDLLVVLRPTASPVLWVQLLGRGTRPVYAPGYDLTDTGQRLEAIRASTKQNCLVLDFGGNTKRLGPVNDPIIPKRKGKSKGEAPVKCCPVCNTYNHAKVKYCIFCGTEFTFEVKIKQQASDEELIRTEFPIVEVFKIEHIVYSEHVKTGKKPIIKVAYYTRFNCYYEFVCVEHENLWAKRKAGEWWQQRVGGPLPETTEEALHQIGKAKTPTHMRVHVNRKYPEIKSFCFDGTAFGSEQEDLLNLPSSEIKSDFIDEEDVPF